jgi:hypothetical protein
VTQDDSVCASIQRRAVPAVLEIKAAAVLVEQHRRPAIDDDLDIPAAGITREDQRNLPSSEGQRCRSTRLIGVPD